MQNLCANWLGMLVNGRIMVILQYNLRQFNDMCSLCFLCVFMYEYIFEVYFKTRVPLAQGGPAIWSDCMQYFGTLPNPLCAMLTMLYVLCGAENFLSFCHDFIPTWSTSGKLQVVPPTLCVGRTTIKGTKWMVWRVHPQSRQYKSASTWNQFVSFGLAAWDCSRYTMGHLYGPHIPPKSQAFLPHTWSKQHSTSDAMYFLHVIELLTDEVTYNKWRQWSCSSAVLFWWECVSEWP